MNENEVNEIKNNNEKVILTFKNLNMLKLLNN